MKNYEEMKKTMDCCFHEGKSYFTEEITGYGYDECRSMYEIIVTKATEKTVSYVWRKRTTMLWGTKYNGSWSKFTEARSKRYTTNDGIEYIRNSKEYLIKYVFIKYLREEE